MNRKRSKFVPSFSAQTETLESRVVLSGINSAAVLHTAAEVAEQTIARAAATSTTMTVSGGTLGSPITFTVTVRAPASAGGATGTVNITSHGSALQTLTLTPSTSTNSPYAESTASVTLTPEPGGAAYYFGKHKFSADFLPSGSFGKSHGSATLDVVQPTYTTLSDGVKVATIATGTGPAIQSGQTANVMYTGYLAKNGKIFDDSINDGGTPFSFTVGSNQVIPGFDAGTAGMQVGETRIVEIPASQGYGSTATGSIPANSTLIFVLTLDSIS